MNSLHSFITRKNKSFRPRERGKKGLKNLQSVKTLAGRTGLTAGNQSQLGKARKQPLTVTAQFQQSLHLLMDTLNQANPFFIRCIKSNANKIPNEFDDETIQRQLRYTGMLETVRIRRAGFNVRLTYDEFIQLYRILLPKGLLSSQNDVKNFLATLNLNRDNYQLGCSKVFLRESEKARLDYRLHQQIMASIVTLQRWFRACLERRRFLRVRNAVITIQSYCRMYLVQRFIKRIEAAVKIQKIWRGYKQRSWYAKLRSGIVVVQAHIRGLRARAVFVEMRSKALETSKDRNKIEPVKKEVLDFREVLSNKREPDVGVSDEKPLENVQFKGFLRSTVSLPTVVCQSSSIFPPNYSSSNRIEDTKHEGMLLDESSKPRISKTYKTIDYSDLDYIPKRKGSGDSVGSEQSLDSQHSSDSHSSPTVREPNKNVAIAKKMEQWSSTSTRSETDSESGATHSAPPIIGEKYTVYNEEVWHKRSDSDYAPKTQLSRTSQVTTKPNIKRELRHASEGLKSLPPIRRPTRDGTKFPAVDNDYNSGSIYLAYDRAPSKAEEILGKPEAPIRNTKKSKRAQVRSLGEEVTDSSGVEKGVSLGTIDESKVSNLSKSQQESASFIECESLQKQLTPKRQRSTLSLDLKRRNSDPASKVSLVNEHKSDYGAQKQTAVETDRGTFVMAGHRFRKVNRFNKEDRCALCNKEMDAFFTQGYKCTDCKKSLHTKCRQNKNAIQLPCDNKQISSGPESSKTSRRKHRKQSRTLYDFNKQGIVSKFSLTGTSQFTDSTDQIISDTTELQLMQDFITNKICKIESEAGENPSEVDILFKQALREFKDNLVQIYSAASKQSFECSVKYKDLIINFMQAMETVCQREMKDKDFPVTMGVNAFRGFMNEFMTSRAEGAEKPSKTKRKKEKKRKGEDTIKFGGHTFLSTIINIPTACEICNSFFMWPIERGLVCQSCRLTCHKKCHKRATINCAKEANLAGESRKVFGVPLYKLVTEDAKVPVVIERLLTTIEMYGIYSEGIYRKSGVSSKIRELKAKMEDSPDEVNFENYQVHVLASVFKCFLREMPEPLLTFECYENFITAANLSDPQDRVSTLYDILKKLPPSNYDMMERLMFHLARVALHEEVNRMSSASLAIVFAPCVLRTNKLVPAQDSLHDIGSQTQCIESIIKEQLRKIRTTLDDIDTLDTARQAATNRLSSLRTSKVFSPEELVPANQPSQQQAEDEEHLLVGHIQEIQKEKEHLTSTLPTLTHATSDDDMLSTDGDGSLDDISCVGEQKKIRAPVIRSISSGDTTSRQSLLPKLKRQSSSDVSVKVVDECEDAPIMV